LKAATSVTDRIAEHQYLSSVIEGVRDLRLSVLGVRLAAFKRVVAKATAPAAGGGSSKKKRRRFR
jgi:hypothetical protein